MPIPATITTKSGRSFKATFDSPPTDQDIDEAAAMYEQQNPVKGPDVTGLKRQSSQLALDISRSNQAESQGLSISPEASQEIIRKKQQLHKINLQIQQAGKQGVQAQKFAPQYQAPTGPTRPTPDTNEPASVSGQGSVRLKPGQKIGATTPGLLNTLQGTPAPHNLAPGIKFAQTRDIALSPQQQAVANMSGADRIIYEANLFRKSVGDIAGNAVGAVTGSPAGAVALGPLGMALPQDTRKSIGHFVGDQAAAAALIPLDAAENIGVAVSPDATIGQRAGAAANTALELFPHEIAKGAGAVINKVAPDLLPGISAKVGQVLEKYGITKLNSPQEVTPTHLDALQHTIATDTTLADTDKQTLQAIHDHFENPAEPFNDTPPRNFRGQRTPVTDNVTANETSQGPTTFKTAKGSTYEVQANGSTIRNKAARPDLGHEGQSGLQPKSDRTVYIDPTDAEKLARFQTQGGAKKAIVHFDNGQIGIKYLDGPNAGKIERSSLVDTTSVPEVGKMPVETWQGGQQAHFGNEITKVGGNPTVKKSLTVPETPSVKTVPVRKSAPLDSLPGVRNLNPEARAAADEFAAKNGISKQTKVTTPEWRSQLESLGIPPEQAAKIPVADLTGQQVNLLGHYVEASKAAEDAAIQHVKDLTSAGVTGPTLDAAQKATVKAGETRVQILTNFTHGSSQQGRGLRMLQDLDQGTLDMSKIMRHFDENGVKPTAPKIARVQKALDSLNEATTQAGIENLPKPKGPRIIKDEVYQQAQKNIREKLGGRLNAGIPLDVLKDLAVVGAYHIENGARTFADFAAKMKASIGDHYSEPELRQVYGESYKKLKNDTFRGNLYGNDILTEGKAGIQSPEVAAKRRALLAEINRNVQPTITDILRAAVRAPLVSRPTAFLHIAGGATMNVVDELGRIGGSIGNVASPLLNKITNGKLGLTLEQFTREGFDPAAFVRAYDPTKTGSFSHAWETAVHGHNSLQKTMEGSITDLIRGREGIGDVLKDVKTYGIKGQGKRALLSVLESPGAAHGAAKDIATWVPAYYRQIDAEAFRMARQTSPAELVKAFPELEGKTGRDLHNAAAKLIAKTPPDAIVEAALDKAATNSFTKNNKGVDAIRGLRRSIAAHGVTGDIIDHTLSSAVDLGMTALVPMPTIASNAAMQGAKLAGGTEYVAAKAIARQASKMLGREVDALSPAARNEIANTFNRGGVAKGFIALGSFLAYEGIATHQYQLGDAGKVKKAKETAGNTGIIGVQGPGYPGSIQVQGKSIPYHDFGIIGTLMALGANATVDAQKGGLKHAAKGAILSADENLNPLYPLEQGYESLKRIKQGLSKNESKTGLGGLAHQ